MRVFYKNESNGNWYYPNTYQKNHLIDAFGFKSPPNRKIENAGNFLEFSQRSISYTDNDKNLIKSFMSTQTVNKILKNALVKDTPYSEAHIEKIPIKEGECVIYPKHDARKYPIDTLLLEGKHLNVWSDVFSFKGFNDSIDEMTSLKYFA